MSLQIFSHIVGLNGLTCRRCGVILIQNASDQWEPGRRVGLIVAPASDVVVPYPVGETDTNELCTAAA